MERQLEEMRERTAASSAALRALAAQGEDVEALVHRKRSLKPLVANLSAEAEALTGRLKDSSAVVQRVVESVRVLDTAQANTRRALERTVDIVGLKNCAEEVAASMQAQDWEKAADAMHRHLSDVQAEGGGSAGEEVAMKALRRALGELQTLMRERCEAAAASGDDASLQRFATIMSKIGLGAQALTSFTACIAAKVEAAAEGSVQRLRGVVALGGKGANKALYAECLTQVLEAAAKAVDEAQALILADARRPGAASGGAGGAGGSGGAGLTSVITVVYSRAAPKIAEVLTLLYEEQRLGTLTKRYQGTEVRLENKVAIELDAILEEVALCLQRLEQFNWYLASRLHMAANAAAAVPTDAEGEGGGGDGGDGGGGKAGGRLEERALLLRELDVARQLPRVEAVEISKALVISGYIPLEEALMRHSVEKGVRNTARDEDSGVSALVDDVFYIIKKCSRRALVTASLNAMGDVVMYANTLLVTTYKDALVGMLDAADRSGEMHLSGGIATLLAGTSVGEQVQNLSRRQVAEVFDGTPYNNLEASAANVGKLHAGLQAELKTIFRGAGRRDEDKAREVLSELASAGGVLEEELQAAISRLAAVLHGFVSPRLQAVQVVDYAGDTASFSESEAMAELTASLDSTLAAFRDALTPACFDTLVRAMVSLHIVPALEGLVLDGGAKGGGGKAAAFSSLGAMLFDKDVRALTGFVSGLTHRPIRDCFARLSQLALILSLGEPQEIFEYHWGGASGSGKISWLLTAQEVRTAMLKRVDWAPDRIKALRLD